MKIIEMLLEHEGRYPGARQIVSPALALKLENAGKARIVGDAPEVEHIVPLAPAIEAAPQPDAPAADGEAGTSEPKPRGRRESAA